MQRSIRAARRLDDAPAIEQVDQQIEQLRGESDLLAVAHDAVRRPIDGARTESVIRAGHAG